MTNIQWTDITSNPIHLLKSDGTHGGHWCKMISSGCTNCYSQTQNNNRFFKFASNLNYTGDVPQNMILDESIMQAWGTMGKSKKIFVCSMTDIFGDWVPFQWIDRIFAYMAIAPKQTFQILTKRPERMLEYFLSYRPDQGSLREIIQIKKSGFSVDMRDVFPLPNVWVGITAETQKCADERIPLLLQTPAAVRFLSCEPLLEELNLSKYLNEFTGKGVDLCDRDSDNLYAVDSSMSIPAATSKTSIPRIDWMIVGGESGKGARDCKLEDIRSLVNQCKASNVACFVKQLGNKPVENGQHYATRNRKGGSPIDFPSDFCREFPV
jgi:protein gp37